MSEPDVSSGGSEVAGVLEAEEGDVEVVASDVATGDVVTLGDVVVDGLVDVGVTVGWVETGPGVVGATAGALVDGAVEFEGSVVWSGSVPCEHPVRHPKSKAA